MNGITTVTTKGQVTIPQSVRTILRVKVGDLVSFTRVLPGSQEAIIKIIPAEVVDKLFGSLSSKLNETNHKKAREKAGKLLLKKYQIR